MSELHNFPFVNQLTTLTGDGRPSENAQFDCVNTSILAGVMWLLGITHLNAEYNPDAMKDEAYGEGWADQGTDAVAYVSWCARRGVRLYPVECPDAATAVARAHQYLAQGLPVVFTQQDDYAPLAYRNLWSHVCVWYKDAPGSLTMMDTYGAHAFTYSDSEWMQRLRSTKLWVLEKIHSAQEDQPMATLQTPHIARYFEDAGNGRIKRRDKNIVMGQGFTTFFLKYGGIFRLPITPEIGVKDHPGVVFMVTEAAIMIYDPDRKLDTAPTEGPCYLMHTDSGPGQRLIAQALLAPLEEEVAKLTKQFIAQPNNDQIAKENTQLKAKLQQLKEIANS